MDGAKSENDLPILFQRGAAALPPKELLEEATAPRRRKGVVSGDRGTTHPLSPSSRATSGVG
jgi:hypothetical protein